MLFFLLLPSNNNHMQSNGWCKWSVELLNDSLSNPHGAKPALLLNIILKPTSVKDGLTVIEQCENAGIPHLHYICTVLQTNLSFLTVCNFNTFRSQI